MRLVSVFSVALALAHAAEPAKPPPEITVAEIPSPAAAGAIGPSLVTAADGAVWLSWLERSADRTTALRFSMFDRAAKKWSAARTIASGADWFVNWADFPALTVGPDGRATAVWFVNNPTPAATSSGAAPAAGGHHGPGYRAFISQSSDAGKTWSAPQPLTRESEAVEFVSLSTLSDGRVLAAWLDGRVKNAMAAHGHAGPGAPMQLYARVLGTDGPDVLVDGSVCDCCPTTLTAFLDGTALLAYRGRSAEEIRDIRLSRFDGARWSEPRRLNNDDWKIAGCPVNGPQLASDGGRVAAAWFTAADNDPRVLVSYSPDAGARFLMPLRIDKVKPAGRVDTTLLRDMAILVTWVGADGAVWLRRIAPDFTAADTVEIAPGGDARMRSVTRVALARDYAGGKEPAQLLVAYAQGGDDARVRTHLVNIPEGDLVESESHCDCAPSAEQLRGFPIRGTLAGVRASDHVVRVAHGVLPGLFAAGTHEFRVEPSVLAPGVEPGRQFFGRIERRDGAWWLFDVRLIVAPQPR